MFLFIVSKVIKSLDELESSCSKLLRQQERQIEDLSSKLLRVKQEREDLSKALRSLEEYEQSGKKDKMNAAKEEVSQYTVFYIP